ncbi:hypothetical protein RHS04_08013 [Rhizoctonia solani]|nr:hypothetical protein RHS04_08013 [Rhizoctonia solani]KAF8750076.1 hypothetical protein RHS01_09576 [Rhizoctonia solani]
MILISKVTRSMGCIRNYRIANWLPPISPVNSLPTEVITRILKAFVKADLYILDSTRALGFGDDSKIAFSILNAPVILSHVCSHWRDIALHMHSLWSHIDLCPYLPIAEEVVDYIEVYAFRPGQLLLNVHVDPTAYDAFPNSDQLIRLLVSVTSRIKSLETKTLYSTSSSAKKPTVLQKCFAFYIPGALKHLTIEGKKFQGSSFFFMPIDDLYGDPKTPGVLQSAQVLGTCSFGSHRIRSVSRALRSVIFDTPKYSLTFTNNMSLDVPRDTFDTRLSNVSVLRLNGSHPSLVKQGIPRSFRTLPGLRVFELNLMIEIHLPDDVTIVPVSVYDPEELRVGLVHEESLAPLLQSVTPRRKPLTLSLEK